MTVPLPARVNPGPKAITCEAAKTSVLDGRRICACSIDGATLAPTVVGATRAPSKAPTVVGATEAPSEGLIEKYIWS